MAGRILGMTLGLEEIVTERSPPVRKVWRTVQARLLVIGDYALGFELQPAPRGSSLRVFIDYRLPAGRPRRWLSALLGPAYARWCVKRIAADAVARFGFA